MKEGFRFKSFARGLVELPVEAAVVVVFWSVGIRVVDILYDRIEAQKRMRTPTLPATNANRSLSNAANEPLPRTEESRAGQSNSTVNEPPPHLFNEGQWDLEERSTDFTAVDSTIARPDRPLSGIERKNLECWGVPQIPPLPFSEPSEADKAPIGSGAKQVGINNGSTATTLYAKENKRPASESRTKGERVREYFFTDVHETRWHKLVRKIKRWADRY